MKYSLTEKTTPFALLMATVVSISALVPVLLPFNGNIIFFLAVLFILIDRSAWNRVPSKVLIIVALIIVLTFAPTIYWRQFRYLLLPIYFILSILVIILLREIDTNIFIELATKFVMVLLIGALIGAIYAYFGGNAIFEFANQDGRANQLFLTTLTNTQLDNFIRPSGIYDEPGSLSFVTCFVAALRQANGSEKRTTWLLLFLGFITSSVAHLAYAVFHAVDDLNGKKSRATILHIFVGLLFVTAIFYYNYEPFRDFFETLFVDRFRTGTLGDDRVASFWVGIELIDMRTFFFGLDSDCAVGLANCVEKGYSFYSATPATLIVHWGIFAALPYYCVMVYLAVHVIRYRNYVLLGVMLLLAQRPYVMAVGYSLLINLPIFLLVIRDRRLRFSVLRPGADRAR